MGATILPESGIIGASAGSTRLSSGTLVFGDSNGVSFGLSGQTLTASVVAGTGGSGVVQWSAGTLSQTRTDITFGNSNGVSFGLNTNGVITGTVETDYLTAQSLQSNKISAGSLSQLRTDVTFGNSNGVTFGLDTNGVVTASVAAVGGAQTGISGIVASDATYTSGTVTFTGIGGGVTVKSNTGQRLDISVAAPVAQTNQTIGLFASSNTYLTSSGTADARSLSFRGDKSITIGISGSEVLFSVGAYLTTAMGSGASTQFVQANAGFNGTNASGTIASNSWSVSVAAPIPIATAVKAVASIGSTGTITRYAPEDHQHAGVAAFAVTNTGNTLGNTRSQVGTFFLAASGGITASQSTGAAGNDTVWLSVAAPVAQTVQSAIKAFGASNTGNTAGNTGVSTGIDWVLAGSNNITISESTVGGGPNTLWVSGPTAGAAQTGISGIIVSDATYTSGTVSFSNAGNITISSSVNGATQFIRLSVAAQSDQSAIKGFGISNTGNTAGNTGLSTGIDWVIAGSNGITASQSTAPGGPNTVWISGTIPAAQTNQTLGLYAVNNTEGASSSSTFDARTVSFQGKGAVSVGFSNGSVVIDAPSAAAGNVTFSAGAASAGLASIVFSNSNGVSFGLNGSTITASAAGGGGGIGGGVSTDGNTAGSTGTVTTGNIIFVGSNAISLSQSTGAAGSNATITINAPATSSLVGTSGLSVSSNGSTISVFQNAIAHLEPMPLMSGLSGTWAPTSSSWYFQPFVLEQPMSGGRLNILVAHGSSISILRGSTASFQTGSTGTGSTNFTYARKVALYSIGAGTNSTRLESVWSNQWSLSIDHLVKVASAAGPNMTVSQGATITMLSSIDSLGGTTTSTLGHSSTLAAAASSISTTQMTSVLSSERNVLSSQLVIPVPFNTTLNPGLYYLAQMWITGSTTAGTGNLTSTADVLSIAHQACVYSNSSAATAYRIWGQTAASSGSFPFNGYGVYSAGSGTAPATVAFSDLRTYQSMQVNYFNLQNSTI